MKHSKLLHLRNSQNDDLNEGIRNGLENVSIDKLHEKIQKQQEEMKRYMRRIQSLEKHQEELQKSHSKETKELKNHIERRVTALEQSNEMRTKILFDKRKLKIDNKSLHETIKDLQSTVLHLELINTRLNNQNRKLKTKTRMLKQYRSQEIFDENERIRFLESRKRNLVSCSKINCQIKDNTSICSVSSTESKISLPFKQFRNLKIEDQNVGSIKDDDQIKNSESKWKNHAKKRKFSKELIEPKMPKKKLATLRRRTVHFGNLKNKTFNKNPWFKRFNKTKK
ncbi:alpha amylase domain protein [Anaeramoeba flamelloides]|uniref:Alpha amylase domain protein n=1 Tax=Anaeramoeba flamelloides TaxID=1746091 RepID=A0AAV7ZDB5_9EUKA|nr:alpha amylase domain protein [Anaeramoeba flamelloides]